jgi:hypothetical protein
MKLYGLYSKKKECLLGFTTTSNSDGDFCVGVAFELSCYHGGDNLWTTPKKETAEDVAKSSTEWYNAGYESPEWNKNYLGKLEVVCLNDYEESK